MTKKSHIFGKNMLRIAMIDDALQKLVNNGFAKEAELLSDEIQRLYKLTGLHYEAGNKLFSKLKLKQQQPADAARIKNQKYMPYKTELSKWAKETYLKEKKRRLDGDLNKLNKKPEGNKNAPAWLLGLFNEDRNIESSGSIGNLECGNNNGSPEIPADIKFRPTKNFFYKIIRNL